MLDKEKVNEFVRERVNEKHLDDDSQKDALLSLAFSAWDVFMSDCGKHLAWFKGERDRCDHWGEYGGVGEEVI